MYTRPIQEIPPRGNRNMKGNNYRLKNLVNEFYYSEDKCIEVIFDSDEYASSYSLYSGLRKAISSLGFPLESVLIKGAVYLRRE